MVGRVIPSTKRRTITAFAHSAILEEKTAKTVSKLMKTGQKKYNKVAPRGGEKSFKLAETAKWKLKLKMA